MARIYNRARASGKWGTAYKEYIYPKDAAAKAVKISQRRMPKCIAGRGRTWESWTLTINGKPARAWVDTTWGKWVYLQMSSSPGKCYKVNCSPYCWS